MDELLHKLALVVGAFHLDASVDAFRQWVIFTGAINSGNGTARHDDMAEIEEVKLKRRNGLYSF